MSVHIGLLMRLVRFPISRLQMRVSRLFICAALVICFCYLPFVAKMCYGSKVMMHICVIQAHLHKERQALYTELVIT